MYIDLRNDIHKDTASPISIEDLLKNKKSIRIEFTEQLFILHITTITV